MGTILKNLKYFLTAALVALSACGNEVGPEICAVPDAEVLDCVMVAINAALGCKEFRANPEGGYVTAQGISFKAAIVDRLPDTDDGQPMADAIGFTQFVSDRKAVVSVRPTTYVETALVVAHEYGHVLGLRYASNPKDPIHSPVRNSVMQDRAEAIVLTADIFGAYIKELRDQHLVCGAQQ